MSQFMIHDLAREEGISAPSTSCTITRWCGNGWRGSLISKWIFRFAANHMRWAWMRIAMKPGLLLQKLTTREPTDDQVEVAIASLRAASTPDQIAEVDSRIKT